MEEGEVGRFREAGAENAVINHGKVEGRNEGILAVKLVGGTVRGADFSEGMIGDSELNFATHLSVLVVLMSVLLKFCRHLHIKVCLFFQVLIIMIILTVMFKNEREKNKIEKREESGRARRVKARKMNELRLIMID